MGCLHRRPRRPPSAHETDGSSIQKRQPTPARIDAHGSAVRLHDALDRRETEAEAWLHGVGTTDVRLEDAGFHLRG